MNEAYLIPDIDIDVGYNGNPLLKRANEHIEWTDEYLAEYVKCSMDPIYFCETYMRIINVDKGLIPFTLHDYQRDMVRSMTDNRYTIITTARQVGKSTCVVGFILWYILFNSEKNVALLANKGDTAREILGKIHLAYQHLPKWLQQGVMEWNKGSILLENNSRVIATATSASAIRGYAINLLFIDEAAFIENWDEFFTSVFPTVSSGESTKIVLVSTPNGLNHYYKLWSDAVHQRNGYHPIEVRWNQVPGRTEKWKQDTLAAMGGDTEKFSQEHEVSFLGSSGTLVAGWKLKELVHQNPLVQKDGLYQYEVPIKDHKYVITADVSRGKGLDYSAFSVINITVMPYWQVCTYRNNNITPGDYASIIHQVAKLYNEAAVMVEINDIGEAVSDTLYSEFEYENVMFTENGGRAGKRITQGFSGNSVDKGLRINKNTKQIGCSLLKLLIEQNQLIITDFNTIQELSVFSKKNSSYEAEPGNHDDMVMGLVIFAWMTDQQYFKDLTDINTVMKLRDKTEEDIANSMLVFGFIDEHQPEPEDTVISARDGDDRWLL